MLRQRTLVLLAATVAMAMIVAGQAISQDTRPAGREGRRPEAREQRDPEQTRQRMERFRQQASDRMRESMGASEEEWKALYPLIEKVQTLLRNSQSGGMQGRMMMGRGGDRGGNRTGERAGAREGTPEREQTDIQKKTQALQTLLENKDANPENIKSALAELRKAIEKYQQELAAAREKLREVITLRQEAQLVLMRVLD